MTVAGAAGAAGGAAPSPVAARRVLRVPNGVVAAAALVAIAGGLLLRAWRAPYSDAMMLAALVATGAPVLFDTWRDARAGRWATDVVAVLAIVGAALLRQPLAGLVIVLMRSGGSALEVYAARRASNALRELEAAAPRLAHRRRGDATEDIPAQSVVVGDSLLIRPGELIPCDGVVTEGFSLVDTSRLTGEPAPLSAEPGTPLMSGSLNGDGVLTMRATAAAAESQYARIVELVRSAQASKAPLARLADRYAVWLTPATLALCVVTVVVTRDWSRVLAVLVVATPCPLILATPVAIVGGISRAARRQIIVRHGGALEALSRVDTVVFDKTGTLTIGRPMVSAVLPAAGFSEREVLRDAGAVEEGSSHLLARTLVMAARAAGAELPAARRHLESPGRGVTAEVEGREISVGARSYILERVPAGPATTAALAPLERADIGLRAYVAVDGQLAGVIEYDDAVRPGVRDVIDVLEAHGVSRTLLLSGDHAPNVRAVAAAVGITDARGDLLPEGKVTVVHALVHEGRSVMMVGDGTNDAPALSAANVGVALASHGGGISAESADVVVLADHLERVAEAVVIGRRTMRIARQSIWIGLGLSGAAMVFAALGYIEPVAGALLQEVIDLASIANALRASRR